MSNFRARLFTEHDELHMKIKLLKKFILSIAFDELPEVDRSDLKDQIAHMIKYFTVLDRRVSRQCG